MVFLGYPQVSQHSYGTSPCDSWENPLFLWPGPRGDGDDPREAASRAQQGRHDGAHGARVGGFEIRDAMRI